MHNTMLKPEHQPANVYGVHPHELEFGVYVEILTWPNPLLQPMTGRLLSYDMDNDLVSVATHEHGIVTSRFSLVMSVANRP